MLQFSEFVWALSNSVWDVFNNFLLIDTTDRSKISSDQKRFFIALSLYSLSFFANLLPLRRRLSQLFCFSYTTNLSFLFLINPTPSPIMRGSRNWSLFNPSLIYLPLPYSSSPYLLLTSYLPLPHPLLILYTIPCWILIIPTLRSCYLLLALLCWILIIPISRSCYLLWPFQFEDQCLFYSF